MSRRVLEYLIQVSYIIVTHTFQIYFSTFFRNHFAHFLLFFIFYTCVFVSCATVPYVLVFLHFLYIYRFLHTFLFCFILFFNFFTFYTPGFFYFHIQFSTYIFLLFPKHFLSPGFLLFFQSYLCVFSCFTLRCGHTLVFNLNLLQPKHTFFDILHLVYYSFYDDLIKWFVYAYFIYDDFVISPFFIFNTLHISERMESYVAYRFGRVFSIVFCMF